MLLGFPVVRCAHRQHLLHLNHHAVILSILSHQMLIFLKQLVRVGWLALYSGLTPLV